MKTILTRIAYKNRITLSGRGNREGHAYYKRIEKRIEKSFLEIEKSSLYISTVYDRELGCENHYKTFREAIERITEYCEGINIYV